MAEPKITFRFIGSEMPVCPEKNCRMIHCEHGHLILEDHVSPPFRSAEYAKRMVTITEIHSGVHLTDRQRQELYRQMDALYTCRKHPSEEAILRELAKKPREVFCSPPGA